LTATDRFQGASEDLRLISRAAESKCEHHGKESWYLKYCCLYSKIEEKYQDEWRYAAHHSFVGCGKEFAKPSSVDPEDGQRQTNEEAQEHPVSCKAQSDRQTFKYEDKMRRYYIKDRRQEKRNLLVIKRNSELAKPLVKKLLNDSILVKL